MNKKIWILLIVTVCLCFILPTIQSVVDLDLLIHQSLGDPHPIWQGITLLADKIIFLAYLILILAFHLKKKDFKSGLSLVGILTACKLFNVSLKWLISRPRPENIDEYLTSSMPSGHASTAVLIYGSLIFLLAKYKILARWRNPVTLLCLVTIFGVAASRVFLHAHYLSDVIMGMLWPSLALTLYFHHTNNTNNINGSCVTDKSVTNDYTSPDN